MFSLVFGCFRFMEISYFLNFPSNENVRKQDLSTNAYSYVNTKFLCTIAGRKDEVFCRIVTKTSDFSLAFRSFFRWRYLGEKMKFSVLLQRKQAIGQLIVEDVCFSYILQETWSKNRGSYFFLFHGNKCSFIIINFLKNCSRKLGCWI